MKIEPPKIELGRLTEERRQLVKAITEITRYPLPCRLLYDRWASVDARIQELMALIAMEEN